MNVFDLQAKISLNSSEFENNLDRAKGKMTGFGSTIEGIAKGIGSALAVAFSVETVKNFVSGAVSEFGRLEQLIGGVDTLFGADSGALQTLADEAYKTAGLSANEYLDTSMSFAASLLQALGGDTAAAVDMVDMAVTDMADNANKMGTNIGSIQNAYQGFAKQNYTMLDNLKLGYGGTKSEMARLINDTGILGDTMVTVSTMTTQGNFEEVVSFDTIVEAIHRVQENMQITGTTAAEASGTIEGSVNSMKAAWDNWQAGLADPDADMATLTDNLVSSFETAADNVVPAVQRIGDSVVEVFTHLTGIDLSPVTTVFDSLKTSITDIGAAFADGGLSGGFEEIVSQIEQLTGLDLSGMTGALSGIGKAFANIGEAFADGGMESGFIAIVEQIEQLTGIDLSWLQDGISRIASAFGGLAGSFEKGGLLGGFSDIAATLTDLTGIDFTYFVSGFQDVVAAISAAAPEIDAKIQEIFGGLQELFAVFSEYLSAIWPIISPIITGMINAFTGFITMAFETLAGLFSNILDAISGAVEAVTGIIGAVTAVLKGDFEAAAAAVKTAWDGVLAFFGGVANGILDYFSNIVSGMAEIGRNMAEGLKNGFSAAIDGIKGIGAKISDGFKNVFDINSPSKVFAQYGKFMAQGLEQGWNAESASIMRTMSDGLVMHGKVDFANSAIGRASSATINGMMASSAQVGGAVNVNLNVDGRTLAQVVFDPLNGLIKQKGVTLGA